MTDSDRSAEEIRRQMRQIRRDLDADVGGIVAGAQLLTDWRRYVAAFPWGSLAAAAALGYLVVPRRLEVIRPDAKTLAQLARRQQLVVEPAPVTHQKPSMAETVFNMLGNMLLRAGIAYAGQQAGKMFGEGAARPEGAVR